MITSFSAQNFKCFRQLKLPKLTRVTVLGGKNNVGKTALLEAIFMFMDRTNTKMVLGQYAARGVNAVLWTPEDMFAPIFTDYDLKKEINLTGTMGKKKETMCVSYSPAQPPRTVKAGRVGAPGDEAAVVKTAEAPTTVVALDITYLSKGQPPQRTRLQMSGADLALQVENVKAVPPAAFLHARGALLGTGLAGRFGQLDVHGRLDDLVDVLRILEPRLKSLSAVPQGGASLIHGEIDMGRKIPVAYMGDGMARLLELMAFLATTPGGCVLVDEIENGIHHSVLPKVWEALGRAARKFDAQLIATTHSYECIAAAQRGMVGELAEDLTYVRLDRKDGETVARTYDGAVLQAAIENEMEIR